MPINKKSNEYAEALGELFAKTPKAVLAAIAVSLLTEGGDHFEKLPEKFLKEWNCLHMNGIVPQKAPSNTFE